MTQLLQNKLNGIAYPNNYYYSIDTLKATGELEFRIERLQKYAPELFARCDKFLDIGSSLGYFLCKHASLGSSLVVGVDKDRNANNIARNVAVKKGFSQIRIEDGSFRTFTSNVQFDTIWLGNCFHYTYIDSGWDAVMKLAGLCKGYCIVEAPVEQTYFEVGYAGNKLDGYSYDNLIAQFSKYFDFIREGESYCSSRKILVFHRKNNTYESKVLYKTLELEKLYAEERPNIHDPKMMYIDKEHSKKYKIWQREERTLPIPAYIMTLDEHVCSFVNHVVDDYGMPIGYCTEYHAGKDVLDVEDAYEMLLYFSIKAFNLGIFIGDPAICNYAKNDTGMIKMFDLDFVTWGLNSLPHAKKLFYEGLLEKVLIGELSPIPNGLNNQSFINTIMHNLDNVEFFKSLQRGLK